ncbi:MAG: hypothetical protein HQK65_01455 [Desulfamplus sp.]|nr:hypothetical protein [Desulfamplus sp.]
MSLKVQDILKKIAYIEADLEIQKQILFSIPSADKDEMEQVIKIIAEKKKMVNDLLFQIKEVDPLEFDRISKFEKAAAEFKKIAAEKKFSKIVTLNNSEPCTISLTSGKNIDCLVKAKDQTGDWTVFTFDGEIMNISSDDVIDKKV